MKKSFPFEDNNQVLPMLFKLHGRDFLLQISLRGVGYNESSDINISVSLTKNGKRFIFVANKKITDMKRKTETILQILGYSLALIIHMVLIMQLAVLLNKSLNII